MRIVWNGKGGVAIKKAQKGWRPPNKVLCPANVETRDRKGLIVASYSFLLLYVSTVPEVSKFLKDAEENRVDINVLGVRC